MKAAAAAAAVLSIRVAYIVSQQRKLILRCPILLFLYFSLSHPPAAILAAPPGCDPHKAPLRYQQTPSRSNSSSIHQQV